MKNLGMKQNKLYYIGRSPAAPPATGIANRHTINQNSIVKLAVETKIEDVIEAWAGVSQIRGKLPIE